MSAAPPPGSMRHILVVNQHGDNRGDESAMLAMIGGLRERLGPCRFTVVMQTRVPGAGFVAPADVEFLPALMAPRAVPGFVVATLAVALGRSVPRWFLDAPSCRLFDAYRDADLVISAPGGPYFGDGYWHHEPMHWWYSWVGLAHDTPTFLFAPSAGPYRRRTWNVVRRWLLPRFDAPLVVRETVSAEHLAGLLGPETQVETTTDSALMVQIPALDRENELGSRADRFVVAVSAFDGGTEQYADAVRGAIRHLHSVRNAHFVVLPQKHGRSSDVAYLERLMAPLDAEVSWELFDPNRDAAAQRGLVAMADLTLAGRYHPLVFAISAHVPVVPVAYEHKAVGVAEAAGLADVTLDADDVTAVSLVAMVDIVLDRLDEMRQLLAITEPRLRAAAGRTADLAAALIR